MTKLSNVAKRSLLKILLLLVVLLLASTTLLIMKGEGRLRTALGLAAKTRVERKQGGRRGQPKPKTPTTTTPKGNPDSFIESFEIGKSVKGRSIKGVRFGRGGKKVLFLAATHGDEYGGEVADQFIDYLTRNREAVPKNTEIHIIPRVNPDGWEDVRRGNARKVDINRNFPVDWQPQVGLNDDSAYGGCTPGPRPGSEPETQALMKLLKKRFTRVISIHSLGGIIDYDGPGEELALEMARASPYYLVDPTDYSGNSSGSLGRYVPKTYKIPVITIELESDRLDRVLDALLVAIRF